MLDLFGSQPADTPTFKVLVDGQPLAGTVKIMRVDIRHELNTIASAALVVSDGDPAAQDFPVSSSDDLIPGKAIEIQGGYQSDDETLFQGIIVRQRVSVRRSGSNLLHVECRDAAYKMALAPRSQYFTNVTDSALFEELISGQGLSAEVIPTMESHQSVVQYQVSDWDFIVSRAERLGMACVTDSGTVKIMPMPAAGAPVRQVTFGQGLFEADLEMDGRDQMAQFSAYSWDISGQSVLNAEASDASVVTPGNLEGAALADDVGAEDYPMRHSGQISQGQLDAWAEARMTWARLSKVRGTVRIQGTVEAGIMDLVDLSGFGDRFSGQGFISGIHHRLGEGDWLTTYQIGIDPKRHHERFSINPLPGDGFVRPAPGLYTGIVTALAGDPDGEHRIQVRIPVISDSDDGVWARLASLDAGDSRGFVFRPEIGDEVVLGCLSQDPDHPVVLGMLHSSALPAPLEASDDNHEKGFFSRGEMKVLFNDEQVTMTLETPNGNKLVLTDADGAVQITDESGNSVTLSSDGITLESASDVNITATGDVNIEGTNISLTATAGLNLEGSSEAKLNSSGSTEVKGSIVQIN